MVSVSVGLIYAAILRVYNVRGMKRKGETDTKKAKREKRKYQDIFYVCFDPHLDRALSRSFTHRRKFVLAEDQNIII